LKHFVSPKTLATAFFILASGTTGIKARLCSYNESLSNVFIVKSNSLFSIDVNVVFSKLTSIVFVYFIENTKI
jgi:hypothetical protein